ncbi:MAG: hypothetical protein ETSY1_19910 [Candidatus Entotheonella factor]|uniref:Uncharacterized protein n=1 Tax=Entotheonella factor TaxID=1429438 RepID=W4LJ90_ENTF1|nr:hypothetical protein [Candidatus Entotheonella palauensis]ETW98173.1 MAG: hypothetical protein ETSY1_19910 [Candidatus Entotheonella factor]
MTSDQSGQILPEHLTAHDREQNCNRAGPSDRRPYTSPQFDVYGHIRDLTYGGSPGAGESGVPNKNPLVTSDFAPTRPKKPSRPGRPKDPRRK